jgi:hypothetical protein
VLVFRKSTIERCRPALLVAIRRRIFREDCAKESPSW